MDPLREVRNRLLNGWQLSKLYTFEVAARHESFALAAEELSLTPSAVSHRMNQLEEELGIQLFVRSHRKVELTHEGRMVVWALSQAVAVARILSAAHCAVFPVASAQAWT